MNKEILCIKLVTDKKVSKSVSVLQKMRGTFTIIVISK